MNVKITETKEYFCWRCGAKFHLAENIRITNHSKTCQKCAEEVFDILNKYEWQQIPTSGRSFAVEVELKLDANDWFRIQEFGFTRAESLNTVILNGPQNIHYCEGNKKRTMTLDENNC